MNSKVKKALAAGGVLGAGAAAVVGGNKYKANKYMEDMGRTATTSGAVRAMDAEAAREAAGRAAKANNGAISSSRVSDAIDSVKDTAKSAGNYIKTGVEGAGEAIRDTAKRAYKSVTESSLDILNKFNNK